MKAFCYEGHEHDPLCDPAYVQPRHEPHPDPVHLGHQRHMEARNQAGWAGWQRTRPLGPSKKKGKKKR